MSKRLIASIKSSIERLDKKIAASKAELLVMIQQKDKFLEMLELVEPKQEAWAAPKELTTAAVSDAAATQPEPSKAPFPAFLKNQA